MKFRPAEKHEVQTILKLYKSVIGTRFCMWNEFYPTELEISGDMAAGNLFVLEKNDVIIGAVSIAPENELDEYELWEIHENAGEFARVVISPDYQGKGLSKLLAVGIMNELAKRGTSAVHICVSKFNIPALKLYRELEFVFLGEKDMYGGTFYLCEKKL